MLELLLAGGLGLAFGSGVTLALRNKIPDNLTPSFLRKKELNASNEALEEEPTAAEIGEQFLKRISKELSDEIAVLSRLQKTHDERKTGLENKINEVITVARELFYRAKERQGGQAARLAAVQYTHIFQKLNRALGMKYYLNIVKNPNFWTDPEGRLTAVQKALDATYAQILSNIRQVNAAQDIEISADVEALISVADDSFTSMK